MTGIPRQTQYLRINPCNPQEEVLAVAGTMLKEGGVVAFPTETVYGLGANALNAEAVAKIFEAKGRPADNPLIVHIDSVDQLRDLTTDIPQEANRLMDVFWPGPLTLVLPKGPQLSPLVTAGLNTVAVRMPNHPVALGLIKAAGVPVAAPSANLSGKPSATDPEHVWEDLQGRIDALVDGGSTQVGVESTVLDLTADPPMILRPGGVTREELEKVLGPLSIDPALEEKVGSAFIPRSPGVKYTHYAPAAEMVLIAGTTLKMIEEINKMALEATALGKKVGILASAEHIEKYKNLLVISMGNRNEPNQAAGEIYRALREFDRLGVDLILAEALPEEGIGAAVMNRLKKAAGHRIIKLF